MIQTICACGERYEVKDDLAGKKVRCLACSQAIFVPGSRSSAERKAASARPGGTPKKKADPAAPAAPARAEARATAGRGPEDGLFARDRGLVAGALAGFLAIAVVWATLTPARAASGSPAAKPEARKAAPGAVLVTHATPR